MAENMVESWIYVLELVCETTGEVKFYIGKTNKQPPLERIKQHIYAKELQRGGAVWTRKHKVTGLVEYFQTAHPFDEDKFTLKYMQKNGIRNVRGGTFCQEELSIEDKTVLRKILLRYANKCYKCGRAGHYTKNCYYRGRQELCYICLKQGHTDEKCVTQKKTSSSTPAGFFCKGW